MLYGIFSNNTAENGLSAPRVGVKCAERILDLNRVSTLGYFDGIGIDTSVFAQAILNDFIALGKPAHQAVRHRIAELLANNAVALADVNDQVFIPESQAQLHLPLRIGDYTDFYAGIHHAENVGRMFRPDGNPLLPNYRHLPVAYHGRASSIVGSGTSVRRPSGQFMKAGSLTFGPSEALDFELELALIIGKGNLLGEPIPVDEAEAYIFGVTLFNDWSARDIQRWEYQPLGPFLGKNFASSMSAWVLPFEDLEPFRITGPIQEPTPLPYLQTARPGHFDIQLEVLLRTQSGEAVCISRSNAKHLYWNFAQMIAHHTISGCNLNIGDILATGTISGTSPNSYGSLLELSWNGTQPISLPDGTSRTFLQNGDTVTLRAFARTDDIELELGTVTGTIRA